MAGKGEKQTVCQWISEADAFKAFATHTGKTESAGQSPYIGMLRRAWLWRVVSIQIGLHPGHRSR